MDVHGRLGHVWVLSLSTALSFHLTPLSYASRFLLLSLSHFLCGAHCVSLFALLFGRFHSLKESYHIVFVGACVCVCLCVSAHACAALLFSMSHGPLSATTLPVAMVVK